LEQVNSLKHNIKVAPKLAKSSTLYKAVINGIQDKKGEDICCIDLRKTHEAVADFFIICTASSTPQIKAIVDNIEDEVEKMCNERPFRKEGQTGQQWILLDYVNIVVHVMHPQARNFYKIEDMWSDGDISRIES
jgi:ribosome-associated protein